LYLKKTNTRNFILLLIFVLKFPATENTLSLSVDVGCMVRKALSSMSKFGVRTPLVSNKLNSFCKDPNSNSFAFFEVEVWTTDTAAMTFYSSFDYAISSVAIEQSSAEDELATGILVADVLVLAD
jgi:hypothetical protein